MNKPPANLITIYGRKPVLEALSQRAIPIFRVHLADSNQDSPIVHEIIGLCRDRQIDIRYHDRMALSRISKNRKQDQGVAADIINPQALDFAKYLEQAPSPSTNLIAVERVTNPQNLGMIIRAVAASPMDGMIIPRRGCAKLDSLVVKASAGSLFHCRLLFCDDLITTLQSAKAQGFFIYGLSLDRSLPIQQVTLKKPHIMVLGNESEGLSNEVRRLCDTCIHIPMQNGVESLNVSVAAGVLAFRSLFSP